MLKVIFLSLTFSEGSLFIYLKTSPYFKKIFKIKLNFKITLPVVTFFKHWKINSILY